MTRIWMILSSLIVLAGCVTAPPREWSSADTIIHAVNVVDIRNGVVLPDQMIIISQGRIEAVLPTLLPVHADEDGPVWIDGADGYAIPGLWDSHVHILSADTDRALYQIRPLFLAHGVTHVRDMGAMLADRARYLDRAQSFPPLHILSSGPQIWGEDPPWGGGLRLLIETPDEAPGIVGMLAGAGVDHIKIYDGVDDERLVALHAAARSRGLALTGHQQSGHTLERSAELGLRLVEHMTFESFTGCGPESAEYSRRLIAVRFWDAQDIPIPALYAEFASRIDDGLCQTMLERAAARGLVFTPTLLFSFLVPDEAAAIGVSWPDWPQDGSCQLHLRQFESADPQLIADYRLARAALTRRFVDAGIVLLAGTDGPGGCAPPGIALAIELELMAEGGLSPLEALQAATLHPARTFGYADRYGVLEPGYVADIVVLQSNPLTDIRAVSAIGGVFSNDTWLSRETLDVMIAEALAHDRAASAPASP